MCLLVVVSPALTCSITGAGEPLDGQSNPLTTEEKLLIGTRVNAKPELLRVRSMARGSIQSLISSKFEHPQFHLTCLWQYFV